MIRRPWDTSHGECPAQIDDLIAPVSSESVYFVLVVHIWLSQQRQGAHGVASVPM